MLSRWWRNSTWTRGKIKFLWFSTATNLLLKTSTAVEAELQQADIVFLLDESDDMQQNQRLILEFVIDFVNTLEIGPGKAQVALVQYSTEPTAEFILNTYPLKEDALNHLRNVKLRGGGTVNTGRAVDFVKNTVFTASSGSRAHLGVPQVLIVVSGRKSEDDVLGPVERCKNAGIAVFAVGVNTADRFEMEQTLHCSTSTMKRDIAFLIDGSDDVRSRFSSIREFIANLVQIFDLDQQKDKVAVVQYSNNAEISFSLDAYTTKDDVLQHIARLKPKGGRPQYIGAALQFVKDNVFVSKAGGRHNESASQILVVLAGGRSRDSPRGPARALKSGGVVIFAIGSRLNHDLKFKMFQISSSLVVRQYPGRDVVFLLDGSDGTRTGFPAMRDFVQRVV
uniref:VWFA domain-containing protein n=1 Tax=Fundulus heteroclitus TaxID=8078 RepID=A0A3Q2R361_FUNHE